jgi:methyl halide transferase
MPDHDWNEHYASGQMPWDSDEPDPALVATVEAGTIPAGRALEVGCGTGTNALWLAAHGFNALGVDVSPLAIDRARGCFHVFDAPEVRARFAALVAAVLTPGGLWLSLIGSTEGAPRDTGPPRRSARDIASAVEPALEIVQLRSIHFDPHLDMPPAAWLCLSRVRAVPAQPSTGP